MPDTNNIKKTKEEVFNITIKGDCKEKTGKESYHHKELKKTIIREFKRIQ